MCESTSHYPHPASPSTTTTPRNQHLSLPPPQTFRSVAFVETVNICCFELDAGVMKTIIEINLKENIKYELRSFHFISSVFNL